MDSTASRKSGRAYLLPYSEYTRSSVAWMASAAFRERRSAINAEGRLDVPADLPPGEYKVLTGVYYWQNGQRLPFTLDGTRQQDDRARIGTLEVRG